MLWEHQKKFLRRLSDDVYHWGLFWEMGTGKTRATIEAIRKKQTREKRNLRVLVLCPPVVITNWAREIVKYSGDSLIALELNGPVSRRTATLGALVSGNRHACCITNYEALTNDKFLEMALDWKPDIVVFDEAHKLKSPTAKRTKKAFQLAKVAKFRFALTGTPILNTPMDIFSIYRCIDLGETFGDNFFGFRAKYFYDRNAGMPAQKYFPKWTMRSDMSTDLKTKMGGYANFIEKKACMDLPPLVRTRIDVPMSPEQTKAYIDMRQDFITFVRDSGEMTAATAATAMTKALRLLQIVSGHITAGEGEDARIHKFGPTPREEALEELLSEYTPGHKIIVWASFRQDYKTIVKICEKAGIEYVEVHGGTPAAKRQERVDRFNTDETCRVFIGNGISAGIGINLVVSDISVYYSRSFSLEADLQSEARNYRGGSEIHQKITRIDLVTPTTIDEMCYEALLSKKSFADNILELARYI